MFARIRGVICMTLLLAAVVAALTGCGDQGEVHDAAGNPIEGHTTGKVEGSVLEGYVGHPASATVPPAAPATLEGTWSWMQWKVVSVGGALEFVQDDAPTTITIAERDEGYALEDAAAGMTVELDGTRVVLTGTGAGSVVYAGELAGDTISGTFQMDLGKGPIVKPWTATRVE
jgi:hypothetical protein